MYVWPSLKKELMNKIKRLLPEAEVIEYERYLHVKTSKGSYRVFYGYGKIRILDESSRKVKIVESVNEALKVLKELIE